mmetsp:Transcript_65913/g.147147  ORF Transcript_65913/g.147147 Transcript_65913/m.147147 type:complete len:208 (+) Transcript_65913:284-907(+)
MMSICCYTVASGAQEAGRKPCHGVHAIDATKPLRCNSVVLALIYTRPLAVEHRPRPARTLSEVRLSAHRLAVRLDPPAGFGLLVRIALLGDCVRQNAALPMVRHGGHNPLECLDRSASFPILFLHHLAKRRGMRAQHAILSSEENHIEIGHHGGNLTHEPRQLHCLEKLVSPAQLAALPRAHEPVEVIRRGPAVTLRLRRFVGRGRE